MAKEEIKRTEKKKCRKCGSSQVYIRIKERSIVCRVCGNIDLIEDQE
jgi:ribosomal protein S27E